MLTIFLHFPNPAISFLPSTSTLPHPIFIQCSILLFSFGFGLCAAPFPSFHPFTQPTHFPPLCPSSPSYSYHPPEGYSPSLTVPPLLSPKIHPFMAQPTLALWVIWRVVALPFSLIQYTHNQPMCQLWKRTMWDNTRCLSKADEEKQTLNWN
jgi:hypothetical protein